jgi:predicted XRE-type DNA-binding protein
MRKTANSPTHITGGNVFDDLGFTPEQALALKFKAKIMTEILEEVSRKNYGQGHLVELLDEHQPVISNLLRGKISQMSIEKLLIYASRLGLKFDIRTEKPGRPQKRLAYSNKRSQGIGKLGRRKMSSK